MNNDTEPELIESGEDTGGGYKAPAAADSHSNFGIYRPHPDGAQSKSRTAPGGEVGTIKSYFRTGQHFLNKTGSDKDIFPGVPDLSKGDSYTDYALLPTG